MSKVAMCRSCESEPLVSTFDFYKKEFICLGCGGLYEWLQPRGADETPELLALMEAREAEWETISRGFLPIGAQLEDCAACRTSGDYSHLDHATDEERAEHENASERIKAFREKVVA